MSETNHILLLNKIKKCVLYIKILLVNLTNGLQLYQCFTEIQFNPTCYCGSCGVQLVVYHSWDTGYDKWGPVEAVHSTEDPVQWRKGENTG